MKIFLCIAVIFIIASLFYLYAYKYKERKTFYNDFDIFNKNLINEISFSQKTLINIVNDINSKSNFNNFIKDYILNDLKKINKIDFLNEDENVFLESYASQIGARDKETQLNYLKKVEIHLLEKIKICEEEYNKYFKTFIKIGFLVGLIAFIFLI